MSPQQPRSTTTGNTPSHVAFNADGVVSHSWDGPGPCPFCTAEQPRSTVSAAGEPRLMPIFDHLRRDHGLTDVAPTVQGMHGQHDGIHGRTWAYQSDPLHHWRWRAEAAESRPSVTDVRAALDRLRAAVIGGPLVEGLKPMVELSVAEETVRDLAASPAGPDPSLSDLSLSSVSAEGSATPDRGKGEPR